MFDDLVSKDHRAGAPSGNPQTGHRSIPLAKEQVHSVLATRNILTGAWISLAIHLAVIAVTLERSEFNRIELWGLTLIDTFLLALILTPLAAIARRELAWYDPVAILSVVYLPMSSFFYLAFVLDPSYVFDHIASFGRFGMIAADTAEFLRLASRAELLLLVFLLIVLFTNRHSLIFRSYAPSPRESRAALITFLIFLIAGMSGWLFYWSQRSFFTAATVSLGDISVKAYAPGTARYIILSTLGLTSITLGIAGGYGVLARDSRRVRTWLLILMIAVTVLADLPSGSRVGILAGVGLLFYVARLFGYRTNRSVWVIGGLVGIVFLLAVTFVRGNRALSSDPNEMLRQFATGRAATIYLANLGSPVEVLFAVDRVSAVMVILQHYAHGGEYLYGQTLVAGIANLAGNLAGRFGLDNTLLHTPLLWANEHILIWLFGAVVPVGTLPPSIPGEFYMQGGWVAFLALSAFFGLMFKWMRERLANSRSLVTRWFLGVFLFRLAVLFPAEVSSLTSILFYTLPIALFYKLVVGLSRDSSSRGHPWQIRSLSSLRP